MAIHRGVLVSWCHDVRHSGSGVSLARVRLPVVDHEISRPTTENLTLLMPEGGWSFKTKKKDDQGRQAAVVATVIPRKRKRKKN